MRINNVFGFNFARCVRCSRFVLAFSDHCPNGTEETQEKFTKGNEFVSFIHSMEKIVHLNALSISLFTSSISSN
jgi:hypothetical protein